MEIEVKLKWLDSSFMNTISLSFEKTIIITQLIEQMSETQASNEWISNIL